MLLQGLSGTIPNAGTEVANAFSELSITNTSLQQCDASHLAVYKHGLTDTVLKAGSSTVIGADNLTGCMPDFLLFCEQQDVSNTYLQCPSIAVRRPVQIPTNQLDLVGCTCATKSLVDYESIN